MAYLMLTQCKLIDVLHLKDIDKLSVVIAAACHDLGHDGFTNNYHMNAVTLRAIESNDNSVQERYHAQKTFEILSKDTCNFMSMVSRSEFAHFRKRVISLILATDMTCHASMVSHMNQLTSINNINGLQ